MSGFRHVQRLTRSLRNRGPRETGKLLLRDLLLPRGGRRDRLWAKWGRPALHAALRRTPPAPPIARLTEWTSPANAFGADRTIRRILVIKVDHLGDFFLALPAFAMLRRNFPHARISLLCGSWNQAMAQSTGFFDEVHVLDYFISRGDTTLRYRGDPAMVRKLGLPGYDLAIDLRVDEDTRALLNHITARCKVGYASRVMPADMALVLPQPPLQQPDDAPVTAHQRGLDLAVVNAVVALLDPLGDTDAALARITAAEETEAIRLLQNWRNRTGPLIAVNTGSGREIKNWPLENFIAVCRWITAELGGTVLLLGAPNQAKDAALIIRSVGAGVIGLVGQCRMERSLAIVRHVDLFLGNDSSLTHASAAMGTPTVAIYSGIDPISVWGPLGPHVTAIRASVPCSPCSLSYITECVRGHVCIRAIPIDAVRAAIRRALRPATAAPGPIAEAAE